MIIATFPTYTQVLPGFEQAISGMRNQLLPLMSVLMIASLVGVAKEGYRAILFHLILLTILVGLAANWQPWFQQASTAVSATFTGDQYDLAKQTERYLVRLQVKADQKDSEEGYVEAFFRAIMAGALLLLGYITKGVVLLFLVLQKILLTFAYALSPIFVGFFALRSTRGIAVNYLMTTVGLVSWPLGFALSACGTYGLVQFFGNLGFFSVAGNVLTLNEAFFALLIIAVWLLVSTIISPVIISKVMATGAQAGSALLANAINVPMAIAGGAASAGAAAATGGASAAGQSAASVLGGIAAGAGAAMQGGAAPISGHSVAALVGGNNPKPYQSSAPSAKSTPPPSPVPAPAASGKSTTGGDDAPPKNDDSTPAASGSAPADSTPSGVGTPPDMPRPQTPNNPPSAPFTASAAGGGSKASSGGQTSAPRSPQSLTMDDEVNRIIRPDFGNPSVSSQPDDHE